MKNFEEGDLVQVVNFNSPNWEGHTYMVTGSYSRYSKEYYKLRLVDEDVEQSRDYPAGIEGAFTAQSLKYVGPRLGTEVDLLKLSVPELASLVAQATARIIELTKNA